MRKRLTKSVFRVAGMDCAAEENLIRMQLDSIEAVKVLEFDSAARLVSVYHEDGQMADIEAALVRLGLGSSHLETIVTDKALPDASEQRRLLWTVLLINFGFFVVELAAGLISTSMSLVADSLDMLADALVYGMSLFAVGSIISRKKAVAKWSGYFQATLALAGLLEVLRRLLVSGAVPDYKIMIVVALLALIANGFCLYLLQQSKDREAHMQASIIFTSNDIIINLGVIMAGVLVIWLGTNLPDLIVGSIVFLLVMRGALRILKLAR